MHSASQPRTLVLVERRPRVTHMAPADVAFLLEHYRGRLEVLPSCRRHRYRLTALGCVGVLVAPTCRLVIRPKIPLNNVFAMLDPLADALAAPDAVVPRTGTETLDFLAGQLARRMKERVSAGLYRAYRERREHGNALYGRIDLPAQLREAPGRKDLLHSQYDDLSHDVPCNQVLKTTAGVVLSCPLLSEEAGAALRHALAGFEGVSTFPQSEQAWEALRKERLPAEYRDVLDLCRLLRYSVKLDGSAGPVQAPSFLLDMERVFERHLTRSIVEAFKQCASHTVAVQVTKTVTKLAPNQPELAIRPDLTIDRNGRTVLVVDAKWKRFAGIAEMADIYQVLAYGTTLGAEGVALVYPGRRWSVQEYRFLHASLRSNVYTVPVGGTRARCLSSARRLARSLKKSL